MNTRQFIAFILLIAVASCKSGPRGNPGVVYSAYYISGFSIANRWAVYPAGYYSDGNGKSLLSRYLKAVREAPPVFELDKIHMGEIASVVFASIDSYGAGKQEGNFYISCFKPDGTRTSKAITRNQLRAIVDLIPPDKRAELEIMREKG